MTTLIYLLVSSTTRVHRELFPHLYSLQMYTYGMLHLMYLWIFVSYSSHHTHTLFL